MRKRIAGGLIALALLVGVSPATTSTDGTREVRLLVTASVGGELSDCGCRSGPQGGLARRTAYIDGVRAEFPEVLILDAGGYASADPLSGDLLTRAISDYMADTGYDAVAVGDEELLYPVFAAGDPESPVKLSANLRGPDGTTPQGIETFRVFERNGVAVGVTAVVDPDLVAARSETAAPWRVVSPLEAAREAGERMREAGARVRVLLAHMPEARAVELGRAVGVFDVVVVGHGDRVRSTHAVRSGVVMVRPGDRGRYVADVRLRVDDVGVSEVDGQVRGLMAADARDPDVHRWVSRRQAEVDERARAMLLAAMPSSAEASDHRGTESCVGCHEPEVAHWRTTPHARALETLAGVEMANDPECVRCHLSVDPMGAGAGGEGADTRGVQCGACHRVPVSHPEPSDVPAVEPAVCRRCHDAENSPDYDPEGYWERVLHRLPAVPTPTGSGR